jgi:hypothetical protein
MRIARRLALPVVCLALTVGSSDRPTAASTGGGQLSSTSTLAAKDCGKDRVSLVLTLAMASDATWTARDQEGSQFSGTYSMRGAGGRILDLQFDAATSAGFVGTIVSDVGQLCHALAAVSSAERKRFVLQLNRKRTKATLSLTYRFAGTAGGGRSGTARYHALLKGPWVAGP